MSKDSLTITDNRTGMTYELPIVYGTYPHYGAAVRASDFRQIRASEDDFGLLSYDPGFLNTASCRSGITFIDGEQGILRYRGYPIDVLAEHSTYLETAYLLINGELPGPESFETWTRHISHDAMVHENLKTFMSGFRHDAHPMGMLVGAVGALSTFYPDAKTIDHADVRQHQITRLLAKMPTLAAYAYRYLQGLPYVSPNPELSYTSNLLHMLFKTTELTYDPNPILEKALDVLLILHADHEQNCSTNAVRSIGSSHADPYVAVAGGIAALYGPLHGGANEAVLHMLAQVGSKDRVPAFVQAVKSGQGRLMGFGHRVYKHYDPRAQLIKRLADEVFEVTGMNPLLDIARELERIALEDDYFVTRKLYPNVDFYSGLIYQAMGVPVEMFSVLFAIARTAGWLAQWQEMVCDPEQKISRPRQLYTGCDQRAYVALQNR